MRVFGLAVSIVKSSPVVKVAVLSAPEETAELSSLQLEENFEIPAGQGDIATQVELVASALESRIQSLKPDLVAVRAADHSPRARQTSGPRLRLLIEGAITAAAKRLVARTSIRTGKDWGAAYGASKDKVDSDASIIADKKFIEATAAALGIFAESQTK